MNRRNFLRSLASGLLVAAAPTVLVPARRFWQVGRNAPVGRRPMMYEWADHTMVMLDDPAIEFSADGATWHGRSSEDILANLRAFEELCARSPAQSGVDAPQWSPDIRYVRYMPICAPDDSGIIVGMAPVNTGRAEYEPMEPSDGA